MTARLVLCFDGTWNKPDEEHRPEEQVETNVRRFHEAALAAGPDDTHQIKWYSAGVGTRWDERLRGGAFGYGIDEIIRNGYEFLVTNHAKATRSSCSASAAAPMRPAAWSACSARPGW
jgi:uncharacterized protein (DUF2235 family)